LLWHVQCKPQHESKWIERRRNVRDILKKYKGKKIRLYTISGVESYFGVLETINERYIALKDATHGELIYIAVQYIESFHEYQSSLA
jgi:hypothetical protein